MEALKKLDINQGLRETLSKQRTVWHQRPVVEEVLNIHTSIKVLIQEQQVYLRKGCRI